VLADLESIKGIPVEHLREMRLAKEREWYLSIDGFIDFARDSGASPQATFEPHGKYAKDILTWEAKPDPESGKFIFVYKLILWPRGTFKSSVFDMALVCWEIARNPNIRILVCSETGKQARKFVDKAMEIIDSEWFRERFGVHRGKHNWKSGAFTSALRTDKHTKESTLQAAGVGEVWTGSHWDLVLMDDVVSKENTKTIESIESLNDWFGEILAQLDPGCRLMVIGTLHHFSDLYCSILKDQAKKKYFHCSVHKWKNSDGSLFFPKRLTHAFIAQQKALLPPRVFACFYENQPYTEETQLFKAEYFKVIADEEVPNSVWSYLMTDWAFIAEEKKKGKADRTAFWVVSIDCNRVVYVRDFYVGRWKPSDSVRIACDLWNRYNPINMKGLVLEDTTHKELLASLFEEVRRQTFIRPKLIPVSGRSQEIKEMRIEAMEPRFRRGDIYFVQSLKQQFQRKWKPLVDEMTEWPYSGYDDIPDALSDIDKQDNDGKWVCPAPPVGWRTQASIRTEPTMIDGKLNPRYGYPADEMRKNHDGAIGADLWRRDSSTRMGSSLPNQDIFRRRS
jgi:hypothetical protein